MAKETSPATKVSGILASTAPPLSRRGGRAPRRAGARAPGRAEGRRSWTWPGSAPPPGARGSTGRARRRAGRGRALPPPGARTHASRLKPFFGGAASTRSPNCSTRRGLDLRLRVPGGDPCLDKRAHALGDGRVRQLQRRLAGRGIDQLALELGERRLLLARPRRAASESARSAQMRAALLIWSASRGPPCTFSSSCSSSNSPMMCSPTRRPSRPTNQVSGKPVGYRSGPRLLPFPS